MNEQYILYIKNFEEHLGELENCSAKLGDRAVKFKKLLSVYDDRLSNLQDKLLVIFEECEQNIDNINLDLIDNTLVKISLLRDEFAFFVNTYSVLASSETEEKKQLKIELSKLNLLLEATTKINLFIEDRKGKLIAKFQDEDHTRLNEIYQRSVLLSSEISTIICILNAKAAFTFSKELEVSSKFQTLEAVCLDMKKKITKMNI